MSWQATNSVRSLSLDKTADVRCNALSAAFTSRPMMPRGAAWATVLLLLAGCGSHPSVQSGTTTPGSVAVSPAPPLVGAGLSGEHLDISTYRGHPVVIFFWATWCDPCRAEQPELNALAARYPSVHFVGDDVKDEVVSARAYVADLKVPFPSVFDQSYVNARAFQVPAIPTTIVVNSEGQIVGRYLGTVSGISQKLDALLSAAA